MLARAKGCDILKLKVTHGCRYVPVANRIAFVIFDTAPMFLDSKLNLMVPDCSHPPAHVENKESGKAIPGQCTSVLKVERKTLCPCIVVFLSLFLCQIQESSKNLVGTWLKGSCQKNVFFLDIFPKSVYPPQGFCENWENERWNLGRKRRFSGQFGFFWQLPLRVLVTATGKERLVREVWNSGPKWKTADILSNQAVCQIIKSEHSNLYEYYQGRLLKDIQRKG